MIDNRREDKLEKQILELIQSEIRTLQGEITANRENLTILRVDQAGKIAEIQASQKAVLDAFGAVRDDFRGVKEIHHKAMFAVITSLLAILGNVVTYFLKHTP